MKLTSLLLVAALLAGAAAACCSDTETVVELTLVDTIPVDFDDMAPGVAEVATVSLAPLTEASAYAEALPSLRCGALDAAASYVEIEDLEVDVGVIKLAYRVDVAPRGSASWTTLLSFDTAVSRGDRIYLNDGKITLGAGVDVIAATVLSPTPALDVQVVGSVLGQVSDLQVAVSLSQFFSSDASGCSN